MGNEQTVKAEENNLKRCPFCGGLAYIGTKRDAISGEIDSQHIFCISCNAQTGDYRTKELSIKAWNRRNGETTIINNGMLNIDL